MGIVGFTSLVMPLNLAGPAYWEDSSSVFLLYLRVRERNLPLCIGTLQFLNSSLYWYPGTIQSFTSLYQVKQFILASGSVTDQKTKELSSSLYNPPHRCEYILSPYPSTFYDHLTTTMVDVSPSVTMLIIISPSGAEYSIRIESYLSYSEKKPWTGWILLGDNQYSKYW